MTAAVRLGEVTLSYELLGPEDGAPVVLICGCGQPSVAWHVGVIPALLQAGHRVLVFDNRGVAPSSSPPAPYSIGSMVDDTLGLLDHLGLDRPVVVGHSLGGWIAETMAIHHPDRVRAAGLLGSCNEATAWEVAITTVERDLARLGHDLPRLFYALETLRYLPNHELQDDAVVGPWLTMIGDQEPWANPGRLGQYEAALAWSLDRDRTAAWTSISVPTLVMAFEHDIDSPPRRAESAAARIPRAEFVELPGMSHLAPFTHGPQVGAVLVDWLRRLA